MLLSSHILSEVEALCDRVTIIKDGHAIDTGTLAELRHLTRTHVEAELAVPAPPDLALLPGVHDADVSGHRFVCEVDTAALGGLLGRLSSLGIGSLTSAPPTLEELFLRHYRGQS